MGGDGRICPNDIFALAEGLNEFDYLLSNDIYRMVDAMKKKLVVEVKQPGYLFKQLNEEFLTKWNAIQN